MKSFSRLLVLSPLVASLLAIGCSGSDPSSPGPVGNVNGSDASPDPTTDAGKITPAVFVSNTPGVTVADVGSPATPDLVLISSNLLQEQSGSQIYQQWLAEVQNVGTTPACVVHVEASFKTVGGAEVSKLATYADGDPYGDGGPVTIPCIPPGKIGSVYANAFVPAMVSLATIATLDVKITPSAADGAEPNIDSPTVSGALVPVFSTEYGIKGSIVGGARVISNIDVHFYPRDARGLVLAQLSAVDLESLNPGASYDFTTSGIDTAFTEYRSFASFIDQAADARRLIGGASPSTPESARESAAFAMQTLRDETAARAAQARSNAR